MTLAINSDAQNGGVEQKPAHKRSVTHEFGSRAFERALETERNELSADSALAVTATPAPTLEETQPQTDPQTRSQQAEAEPIAAEQGRVDAAEQSTEPGAVDSSEADGAEPGERPELKSAPEQTKVSAEQTKVSAEQTKVSAEQTKVSAEQTIEEPSIENTEPEAPEDGLEASAPSESSEDSGQMEAEPSPETHTLELDSMEIEVADQAAEADQAEGEIEAKELHSEVEVDVESLSAKQGPPVAESNTMPQSSVRVPINAVDAWGRQAFNRATASSRATAAAGPTPIDATEIAEKIANTRGSMSGSRARIVFGEGSERVAMIVTVRNGAVHIDARAADAALAQSLELGAGELSEALAQHGLSLGDMQARSDGDAESDELDEGGQSLADIKPNSKRASQARRGVRVVA